MMYEQVDFHFRYQAGNESLYALLLKYLQAKKHGSRKLIAEDLAEFPKEQMVLWALFAFWHPLACKALGSFNETQLKQKARNQWLQLGDQNNSYFHRMLKAKIFRNTITHLWDENGQKMEEVERI